MSCKTAQRHVRGRGLQGFPSLLLGPAEMEPDTGQARALRVDTTVTSGAAPKAGLYQRGDLIFHWKRFGKIEPDADE